ncbi:DUF6883 domain-containing protein [Mycobacterium sp. HM-7]
MSGLTRSQLESWSVDHLHAAADSWNSAAELWENSFHTAHVATKRPGGTEWQGDAADTAQDSTWRDLVHVRGSAESLRSAAKIASTGADAIRGAHRSVMEAISDAETDEFTVGDDLSVTDQRYRFVASERATRQAAARQHADNIRYTTRALVDAERHTSDRMAQAVDLRRFKQDMQDGEHNPYTGADNHKPQPKTPLPPQFDPNTGVAQGGGFPFGKVAEGEVKVPAAAAAAESGPLANAAKAVIDPKKFEGYSMDPTNLANNGKWQAWQQVGFNVDTAAGREAATQQVLQQIRAQLPNSPAVLDKMTQFGQRYEVSSTINGPTGRGTLKMIYQMEDGVPRLITNWLEVH